MLSLRGFVGICLLWRLDITGPLCQPLRLTKETYGKSSGMVSGKNSESFFPGIYRGRFFRLDNKKILKISPHGFVVVVARFPDFVKASAIALVVRFTFPGCAQLS